MSSTGQTTSSFSNFQSVINAALADYADQTGIDLARNPFAEKIELSNSPEAILELLQEREKAFKEYREGNRRLISCISPAVKVIHAFSGILGEAVSLVSITYNPVDLLNNLDRSPFLPQRPCSQALMLSLLYVP
jgi:fungal STAND N-terminal Goodbye domain